MLAAVFEGEGRLVVKEMPEPRLTRDDDVLLRVAAVGICGSDLHVLEVPPGHPATPGTILGHEYVAEIVESGPSVVDLRPGDPWWSTRISPAATARTFLKNVWNMTRAQLMKGSK